MVVLEGGRRARKGGGAVVLAYSRRVHCIINKLRVTSKTKSHAKCKLGITHSSVVWKSTGGPCRGNSLPRTEKRGQWCRDDRVGFAAGEILVIDLTNLYCRFRKIYIMLQFILLILLYIIIYYIYIYYYIYYLITLQFILLYE